MAFPVASPHRSVYACNGRYCSFEIYKTANKAIFTIEAIYEGRSGLVLNQIYSVPAIPFLHPLLTFAKKIVALPYSKAHDLYNQGTFKEFLAMVEKEYREEDLMGMERVIRGSQTATCIIHYQKERRANSRVEVEISDVQCGCFLQLPCAEYTGNFVEVAEKVAALTPEKIKELPYLLQSFFDFTFFERQIDRWQVLEERKVP